LLNVPTDACILLRVLVIVDSVLVMEPILDWMDATVLVRLVTADEIPLTVVVRLVSPVPMVLTLVLIVDICELRPERLVTLVLNAETALFTEAKPLVTFLPSAEIELVTPLRLVLIPVRVVVRPVTLV